MGRSVAELKYLSLFWLLLLLSLVLLAAGPAWLLCLKGGQRSEVDLLLGCGSHQELGSVDEVLADLDVSLVDEHSSLMDALGLEAFLIDSGLQSLVKELIEGETQDVIELELFIGEETISVHSVEKCGTFEKSSGIFFLEGEELPGCLPEFSEEEMNSPYFSLVLKAVFADQLKFLIDSLLFEGSSGSFEGGGIYIR